MNGIARMAITIINQSLCLRSAFIITDENCSGGLAQPQISKIPNPKLQHPINHQIPTPKPVVISLWDLVIGTSLELGSWSLELYVGDSASAICRINSHALCRCSSVVSTLPRPIRITVPPRN